MRPFLKTAALALFAIGFAFAAGASTPEVMASIPGHAGLRDFDLLRLVVPDLVPGADGGAVIASPAKRKAFRWAWRSMVVARRSTSLRQTLRVCEWIATALRASL